MIFYLARNAEGKRILETTQVKAKAVNKDFSQIDVPVDKEGLRGALQELISEADCGPDNSEPDCSDIPEAHNEFFAQATLHVPRDTTEHDHRCAKCHTVLTATEQGAKEMGRSLDLTTVTEWMDYAPAYVITRIKEAAAERELALEG